MSYLQQLDDYLLGTIAGCPTCGGCANCFNNSPVPTWNHPTTCYMGMDYIASGQECADDVTCLSEGRTCCGLGCRICKDDLGDWINYGVDNLGKRFLMRYEQSIDAGLPLVQARDAFGKLHDLRSNEPWQVPIPTSFIRAPVWGNHNGQECLGIDGCDWTYTISPLSVALGVGPNGGGICDDASNEPVNTRMIYHYPDTTFKTGFKVPKSFENLHCREPKDSSNLIVVPITGEYLNQTVFLRSYRNKACTANALVGARSKVSRSGMNCSASYAFGNRIGDVCTELDREYYNENIASRSIFDFIRLLDVTAGFTQNPNAPFVNKGVSILKTAVINTIATGQFSGPQLGINFKQLDAVPSTIEKYRRNWNLLHGEACEDLPVVDGLEFQGQLQNAKIPIPPELSGSLPGFDPQDPEGKQRKQVIPAELVITEIDVEASVVLHRVNWHENTDPKSDGYEQQVRPHIRLKMQAKLAVRMSEEITAVLKQPWLSKDSPNFETEVKVTPQADCYTQVLPTVTGLDKVEYVINADGKQYVLDTIPETVTWWGCLGSFSNPSSEDERYIWRDTGNSNVFYALAEDFAGTRVPGGCDYTHTHPDDPSQVYTGNVMLAFVLDIATGDDISIDDTGDDISIDSGRP